MIIKNCPLGDLHGSMGGITFYGTSTKQKARMRTNPHFQNSPNLLLSQLNMGLVSMTWRALSPATKLLWQTFATTFFHPHNVYPVYPYSGYQAYVSLFKMWQESENKLCPFLYKFNAGSFISPLSASIPAFSSVPPTRDFFGRLCKIDLTPVPVTCDKLEIIDTGFVQFRLNYPHTPPPPLFENLWQTEFGQRFMFSVWASDGVPTSTSPANDVLRYYLGCTGYIANPINTLSNSITCTIKMDCSQIIAKNNVFPSKGGYIWLGIDRVCESGAFSGLFLNCVPINTGFSW